MKKILFISGTRADFGKLKPLIRSVSNSPEFECRIFITGMHLVSQYGNTYKEIEKSGFHNTFLYMNQTHGDRMEMVMANTIHGLSRYLDENPTDLIVVHGDRVEALAGATVGALRNTLVAHIEGGELSGTIDDLMRHATSKLSHIHFVASDTAAKRLIQLGETPETIYTIGSPDLDIMMSSELPSLEEAKKHYQIEFQDYAIAMLHPVTTEYEKQSDHAEQYFSALSESNEKFIAIYPNNDFGSEQILNPLRKLEKNKNFKIFPSLRFEYFLTLLKNAKFIVGNSSAGIHEAPAYGVPTINIGSRQNNRFKSDSITDVEFNKDHIKEIIQALSEPKRYLPCLHYGDGQSALKFMNALQGNLWSLPSQKVFREINHV